MTHVVIFLKSNSTKSQAQDASRFRKARPKAKVLQTKAEAFVEHVEA